jgi:outer membrane lipoprotein LolB
MSLIVASQPQQSFYAGFTLEGNADAGRLALSSPLGNMLAELIWEPGRAELVEGSKRTEYGSLDDLTNQVTGTQLPVPALFDWLQGKNTVVEGWESDLSALAQGKLSAQRLAPDPTARLRIILTD